MAPLSAPFRTIVRTALPPRCPACGVPVAEDHRFCAECWDQLRFLGPPWCARCCTPFSYDRGAGTICAACMAAPPAHAGVRAAVAYGDVARKLALGLKYGGRAGVAETMARPMARLLPDGVDWLVPVPLHRWRLWRRGYNQAALIARAVGRIADVPVSVDVLARTRHTPVLRGLSGRERRAAVARAFVVRADVAGAAVVLVDDVHTSGATAEACTAALLKAGARSVSVLCWARVLGSDD
ncbi:ComF family protein [Sphingomonas sp.]|uniref:ComF family protein n=1 Tax=Sphingomonas sp. TaxID=28214 RepID=UPI0035BC370E